jgi:NAD(P)-dependent dehydrogenase (short-subunit alcohol dehydrogenase family)
MTTLRGKRVLVTGAARGIGRATARELALAGAEVILTDREGGALADTAEAIRGEGGRVHTRVYDVSDQAAVEATAVSVRAEVGPLDVLINNAGVGHQGPLVGTSLSTWRKLIDVNFYGPLYHVYAYLPQLREQRGQIVNVSSGQAFFRLPSWGAYAAAKAALGVFSEVLHFELSRDGVAVTTVYPFMVDTPFYHGIEGDTRVGRLAMKLVPYYSMKPETVAHLIVRSVQRRQRLETVSSLNRIGQLVQAVPRVSALVARVTSWLLVGGSRTLPGVTP